MLFLSIASLVKTGKKEWPILPLFEKAHIPMRFRVATLDLLTVFAEQKPLPPPLYAANRSYSPVQRGKTRSPDKARSIMRFKVGRVRQSRGNRAQTSTPRLIYRPPPLCSSILYDVQIQQGKNEVAIQSREFFILHLCVGKTQVERYTPNL